MGQPARGDGGAQAFDGGRVAQEVVEVGGKRGCRAHSTIVLSSSIMERGHIGKCELLNDRGKSLFLGSIYDNWKESLIPVLYSMESVTFRSATDVLRP